MFSYLKPRHKRNNSSLITIQPIEQITSLELAFSPNQKLLDSFCSQDFNFFEPKTAISPPTTSSIYPITNKTESEDEPHASFANTSSHQKKNVQKDITEDARLKNPIATNLVDISPQLLSGRSEKQEINPSAEPKSNIPSTDNLSRVWINDKLDADVRRSRLSLRMSKFNLLNSIPHLARKRASQSSIMPSKELSKLNSDRDSYLMEKENIENDPSIRGTVVHDFSAPRRSGVNHSILKIKSIDDVISCPSRNQPSPKSISTNESPVTPIGDEHDARIFNERSEDEPYLTSEEPNPKTYSLTELALSNAQCFPHGLREEIPSTPSSQCNDVKNEFVTNSFTDWNSSKYSDDLHISNNTNHDPIISLDGPNDLATKSPSLQRTRQSLSTGSQETLLTTEIMSINRLSTFSFNMEEISTLEKEMEKTYLKKELQRKYEAERIYQMLKSQDSHYIYESTKYNDLEKRVSDFFDECDACNFHEKRIRSLLYKKLLCKEARHESGRNKRAEYELSQPLKHDLETSSFTHSTDSLLDLDEKYFYNAQFSTPQNRNHYLNFAEDFDAVSNRRSLDLDETLHGSTSLLLSDEFYFHDGEIITPPQTNSSQSFDKPLLENIDNYPQSWSRSGSPFGTEIVTSLMHRPQSPKTSQPFENNQQLSTYRESSSLINHNMLYDSNLHESMLEQLNSDILEKKSTDLPEDSQAAYQSALASATFIAQAKGRFRRDINSPHEVISHQDLSQSVSIIESYLTQSQNVVTFYNESEDSFDLVDEVQDRDIIAQANAQVLANDSEGFYGNEFDIYPIPHTKGEGAIWNNGGYFGPKGSAGLQSSHGGRFGPNEGNLTPITERSEYSNRNSYMSPAIHSPNSMRDIASLGLPQWSDFIFK